MSAAAAPQVSPGPWVLLGRRLRHNRVAMIGLWLLGLLYLSACFAGFLAPYHYADGDPDSSQTGPMLFGSHSAVATEVAHEYEEDTLVTVYESRRWTWFEGGVHFHDSEGNFTLRPHVHPVSDLEYTDQYGDPAVMRAVPDRSVSLPIEFFVESEEEHEVFSVLGLFAVTGKTHLFGVRKPDGLEGSARVYLLGSDGQGRDLLSRMLYGAQISLSVGLLGIAISMSIGLLVGGISGYFGGAVDFVSMRIVEVILSVPSLYLLIVLGGVIRDLKINGERLTSTQTYLLVVLALATVGWASNSRVIRGMVLSLKQGDYVVAARASGVSSGMIIARHILPNTFSFVIVTATLYVPYYILGEVSLSFLGLGIQEPEASLGNMLREAQSPTSLLSSPWLVAPGVLIFVVVLAYNFLGDGLRDAADPKAVIVRKRKQTPEAEEEVLAKDAKGGRQVRQGDAGTSDAPSPSR